MDDSRAVSTDSGTATESGASGANVEPETSSAPATAPPAGYRPANPFNTRTPHYGSGYPVQLPVFEGPLDLLLFLIEREELDINEVSLVAVTDQYLRTIEQWEEIEPGALADFLVVASRLLYIKSNRLLPRPPSSEEEEEEGSDSLIRHLLEYRQFKRIAESLRELEEAGQRVFARAGAPPDVGALGARPPDLSAVDLPLLQKALQRALARVPDDPPPPKVQAYAVTVAEKIDEVRSVFQRALSLVADGEMNDRQEVRVSFSDVVETSESRLEIVVTFLAVLELMKQHELAAVQETTFGEIYLVQAQTPMDDAHGEHVAGIDEPDADSNDDLNEDSPS